MNKLQSRLTNFILLAALSFMLGCGGAGKNPESLAPLSGIPEIEGHWEIESVVVPSEDTTLTLTRSMEEVDSIIGYMNFAANTATVGQVGIVLERLYYQAPTSDLPLEHLVLDIEFEATNTLILHTIDEETYVYTASRDEDTLTLELDESDDRNSPIDTFPIRFVLTLSDPPPARHLEGEWTIISYNGEPLATPTCVEHALVSSKSSFAMLFYGTGIFRLGTIVDHFSDDACLTYVSSDAVESGGYYEDTTDSVNLWVVNGEEFNFTKQHLGYTYEIEDDVLTLTLTICGLSACDDPLVLEAIPRDVSPG